MLFIILSCQNIDQLSTFNQFWYLSLNGVELMGQDVVYLAKQALILALVLSLPVVLVASVVGLLFSFFQAVTQIQDQTLAFAIKLIFIIIAIYFTVDWVAGKLYAYTILLYDGS